MKKIILLLIIVIGVTSCNTSKWYSTASASKDNISYVIVLSDNSDYSNVEIQIDEEKPVKRDVKSLKLKRKAEPVIITPGKHKVRVINNGKVIVEENIFIGIQETKKIVLR
jgi:hypothetical protein